MRIRASNHRNLVGTVFPVLSSTVPIAVAVSQLFCGAAFAASESEVNVSMSVSNEIPMRPIFLALKRADYEEQERQKLQADQEREARQKEEEAARKKGEPAVPEGFGSEKPSLGVKLSESGPNVVTVSEIMPGSGAYGLLRIGDQILFIAGVKLTSLAQMPSIMGSRSFNETVVVKVLRNGEKNDVAIVLRQFTAPVGESGSTAPSVASGMTPTSSVPTQSPTTSSNSTSSNSDSTGPTRISAPSTPQATPDSTEPTAQGTPIVLPPAATPAAGTAAESSPPSAASTASGSSAPSGSSTPPAPSIRVGASTPPVEPLIPVGASTPSQAELEKSSSARRASRQAPKKTQSQATSSTSNVSSTSKPSVESGSPSTTVLAAPATTSRSATSSGSAGSTASSVSSGSSTVSSGASSSTAQSSKTSATATASGGAHAPAISSKEFLETEKKLTQSLIDTYLKRADVYRKLERFDASLDDYNASIKIDAKLAPAYSGTHSRCHEEKQGSNR